MKEYLVEIEYKMQTNYIYAFVTVESKRHARNKVYSERNVEISRRNDNEYFRNCTFKGSDFKVRKAYELNKDIYLKEDSYSFWFGYSQCFWWRWRLFSLMEAKKDAYKFNQVCKLLGKI